MSLAGARDRQGILAALAAERGVVILPTDTVPGLHARLDRPLGLIEMARLKGRAAAQPFLVLVDCPARARRLCGPIPDPVSRYLERAWPGPFTLILAGRPDLPAAVTTPAGTVAIRVPEPEPLRSLLDASGPLASTSVNAAGAGAAGDLAAAAACFPDLPCWSEAMPGGAGRASALVDLSGGAPRLVRSGPVDPPSWDQPLS